MSPTVYKQHIGGSSINYVSLPLFAACTKKAAGHYGAPSAETGALCHVQQQQVVPPQSLSDSLSPSPWSSQWVPACSTLIMSVPALPISSIPTFPLSHCLCHENYANYSCKTKWLDFEV